MHGDARPGNLLAFLTFEASHKFNLTSKREGKSEILSRQTYKRRLSRYHC